MATGFRYMAGIAAVFSLSLSTATMAQQVLDSYVAVIGPQDRFNSSGTALTQVGQMLAQDRANFHRFGIRQQGDTADRTFLTTEGRASIPALLGGGFVDPAATRAILGEQDAPVLVEVLGSGGRVTGLRVTLATGAPQQQALPGMSAPPLSDLTWSFGRYPADLASIASADLYRGQELLVSLRCVEANGGQSAAVAGIDPTPGIVTLHLAPQLVGTGLPGQEINAELALGPSDNLDLRFEWRAPPSVFSADLVLVPEFSKRLTEGRVAIRIGAQTLDFAGSSGLGEAMSQLSQACMSQAMVLAKGCANTETGAELAQCIRPSPSRDMEQISGSELVQPAVGQTQTSVLPIPDHDAMPAPEAVRLIFLQALGGLPDLGPVVEGSSGIRLRNLPGFLSTDEHFAVARDPGAMLGPLQALVSDAVAQPVPNFVSVDLRLNSQLVNPGTPGSTLYRPDFEQTFPRFGAHPAITAMALSTTKAVMGAADNIRVPLLLRQPFYFQPPATEPAWQYEHSGNAQLVLRVRLALSNIRVDGQGLSRFRDIATADAEVRDATVILVTRDRPGAEAVERVLHRWEATATAVPAIAAPQSARDISAIYGMPLSGDRLVAQSIFDVPGLSVPKTPLVGLPGYAGGDGSATEAVALAIQLNALIAAGPERAIDMDFTQGSVAPRLLTGPEAAALYPLALLSRSSSAPALSQFDRHAALSQGDAALRAKITERSPALPLQLRMIHRIGLPEYNFGAGGFPLTPRVGLWLPLAARQWNSPDLLPDLLDMGVDDARRLQELLAGMPAFSGGGGPTLYAGIDYTVTQMSAPKGLSGPIRAEDLRQVTGVFHVDSIALYADPQLTQKIRDLPVPEDLRPEQNAGLRDLPAEVFASSYDAMLAAVAATEDGRVALERGDFDPDNSHAWPAAQRADMLASHRASFLASARTDYWIGATMTLSPYDDTAGGFPMSVHNLRVGNDIPATIERHVGISLRPAVNEDFTLLRVDPAQRDAVAGMAGQTGRVTVLMRVPLVAAGSDRNSYVLSLGGPEEVIFGPGGGPNSSPLPQRVALRVALRTPDRTKAMNDSGDGIVPPEVLVLDGEGIDLIALSLDPMIYDDSGFLRMLDERLAREVQAGRDDSVAWPAHDLPWGRFFQPGTTTLRPDQVQALLPAFREWSLARASMLPDRVILPVGGSLSPVSRCAPLREVNSRNNAAPPPVMRLAEEIIGGRNNYAAEELDINAQRPSVGPDRLWTTSAGSRRVTWHSCGSTGLAERDGAGRRLEPAHVGLVLQVPDQPLLGRRAMQQAVPNAGAVTVDRAGSATYELDLTETRLAALPDGFAPPPGMRAVLILKGAVQRAETFEAGNPPNGKRLFAYAPEDWTASAVYPLAATDVLGLSPGMSLTDFEAAVRKRMPAAQRWVTTKAGKGLFGHALMFENTATKEVVGASFLPDLPDQPVVAVMRFLDLPQAQTSRDALRLTFESKYGPVPLEAGTQDWIWGGLPSDLDYDSVCGGRSTTRRESAAQPEMVAEGDEQRLFSRTEWAGWTWPITVEARPNFPNPDPLDCNPSLTVSTREYGGNWKVLVWLMDRGLAERLVKEAPVAAPAALDLDL